MSRRAGVALLVGLLVLASPPAGSTPSSPQARSWVLSRIITARLLAPFGVVSKEVCSMRGSAAVSCRSRLLATHDEGATWSDITPRVPDPSAYLSTVAFPDPYDGWVVEGDCARSHNWLARSTNGGRTWAKTEIAPIGCHAGAGIEVDFVDPYHGFLVNQDPVGADADLQRSADGGQTWSSPRRMDIVSRHNDLVVSEVRFVNTAEGWGGDAVWHGFLASSTDGGGHWTRRFVGRRVRHGFKAFDLPTFFDRSDGVLPITFVVRGRMSEQFFATVDQGRTWRLVGVLHTGVRYRCRVGCPRSLLPVSIAGPATWWLLAGTPAKVFVTYDAGLSWSRRQTHLRLDSIDAVSSTYAWSWSPTGIYATRDGGTTWTRLRPHVG